MSEICAKHEDVIRRLVEVENKINVLEDKANNSVIFDTESKRDIKELRTMVSKMELVLVDTINKQTKQMWKLIFILVSIFSILLGVSKMPKLW